MPILQFALIMLTVIACHADESPDLVVFHGQEIAWSPVPVAFDPAGGTGGHGDGIAISEVRGTIVRREGRDLIFVAGAQLFELPTDQFSGVKVKTLVATSDDLGRLAFRLAVGAAIQRGGKRVGVVYQSCRKRYEVITPGCKVAIISLCLGHPPFRLQLAPAEP